jgi:hypothetical protein
MSEQDFTDETIGRRLRAELPRYAAPARLRGTVLSAAAAGRRPASWVAPLVSAAATVLLLLLVFLPLLPRHVTPDPTETLLEEVLAEYIRVALWGARRPDVIPPALAWLRQESGIDLSRAFTGDEQLAFVGAEPVYLERQRGVAMHYRDPAGHLVTYVVLPITGIRMPERQRVQVGRFRPALLRQGGLATWVWPQAGLACFLVADMQPEANLEQLKDYFLRVRLATEPALAR